MIFKKLVILNFCFSINSKIQDYFDISGTDIFVKIRGIVYDSVGAVIKIDIERQFYEIP